MDEKPWYLSKTTWATIITMLVGLATAFKWVHIGPIVVDNLQAESEGVSQTIIGGIEFVLGAIGLWGRLTAKTKLTT